MDPLNVILVTEDSKCSRRHETFQCTSTTTLFLDPMKLPAKLAKEVIIIKHNDSYLNKSLPLSLAIWFVDFSLMVKCYHIKETVADPQPKYHLCVPRCNVIKSLKEAVADHGCVHNSNKIGMFWLFWRGQHGIMGEIKNNVCSRQQQEWSWENSLNVLEPSIIRLTLDVILHCSTVIYRNNKTQLFSHVALLVVYRLNMAP